MAWGVVWRVERISPYVGIRMGGIGWMELWRASDWLRNDKKQLKVKQSRQTQVYLLRCTWGLKRQKQVQ